MAFPDVDELFGLVERIVARIWRECRGVELETPFPRMQWDEADLRYGSYEQAGHMPYFGLEIEDATAITRGSEFGVDSRTAAKAVRYLSGAEGVCRAVRSRSSRRSSKGWGARGSAWIVFRADGEGELADREVPVA